MNDQAKRDAAVEQLARKAAVVKRVLGTPEGQELLELLRKEFFTHIEAKEKHQVIFNAGRADVYSYLLALLNFNPDRR